MNYNNIQTEVSVLLQNRRHRRIYTNDGQPIHRHHSNDSCERTPSDDNISTRRGGIMSKVIRPVRKKSSQENFTPAEHLITSPSRDLSPGRKRPITSIVSSRYYRMMPATNSKSPPNGYVTTFTKSGRMVWQRMSSNINSQHRPWILQLPFIRQWNNARRNIHNHNGLGFFLLPAFQNNNTRLSEESMAVHTGASNNIFEDEEEGEWRIICILGSRLIVSFYRTFIFIIHSTRSQIQYKKGYALKFILQQKIVK